LKHSSHKIESLRDPKHNKRWQNTPSQLPQVPLFHPKSLWASISWYWSKKSQTWPTSATIWNCYFTTKMSILHSGRMPRKWSTGWQCQWMLKTSITPALMGWNARLLKGKPW
jgi:hypothetical protein